MALKSSDATPRPSSTLRISEETPIHPIQVSYKLTLSSNCGGYGYNNGYGYNSQYNAETVTVTQTQVQTYTQVQVCFDIVLFQISAKLQPIDLHADRANNSHHVQHRHSDNDRYHASYPSSHFN